MDNVYACLIHWRFCVVFGKWFVGNICKEGLGCTGGEFQWESKNPFLQRFLPVKSGESKLILINESVYNAN